MPVRLGKSTGPRTLERTCEAGSDLSAGDVVAIDQSEDDANPPIVDEVDDNDANLDELAGVVTDDVDAGDSVSVIISGLAIAAADSGIDGGERLGEGTSDADTTDGMVVSADGGNWLAVSDEGGVASDGTDLSDNEAEILVS